MASVTIKDRAIFLISASFFVFLVNAIPDEPEWRDAEISINISTKEAINRTYSAIINIGTNNETVPRDVILPSNSLTASPQATSPTLPPGVFIIPSTGVTNNSSAGKNTPVSVLNATSLQNSTLTNSTPIRPGILILPSIGLTNTSFGNLTNGTLNFALNISSLTQNLTLSNSSSLSAGLLFRPNGVPNAGNATTNGTFYIALNVSSVSTLGNSTSSFPGIPFKPSSTFYNTTNGTSYFTLNIGISNSSSNGINVSINSITNNMTISVSKNETQNSDSTNAFIVNQPGTTQSIVNSGSGSSEIPSTTRRTATSSFTQSSSSQSQITVAPSDLPPCTVLCLVPGAQSSTPNVPGSSFPPVSSTPVSQVSSTRGPPVSPVEGQNPTTGSFFSTTRGPPMSSLNPQYTTAGIPIVSTRGPSVSPMDNQNPTTELVLSTRAPLFSSKAPSEPTENKPRPSSPSQFAETPFPFVTRSMPS